MQLQNVNLSMSVLKMCEIQTALSFNSYFIETNFLQSFIAKDIFAIPSNIRMGNFFA